MAMENQQSSSPAAASGIFGLISSMISAGVTSNENELNRWQSEHMYDREVKDRREDATTAFERQKELLGMQQDYQSSREDTQYQRQVSDAIKAGLNPAIAGGQVAPSAPVSATQVQAAQGAQHLLPKYNNPGQFLADAGNNLASMLFQSRKQQAEVSNLESQSNYNNTMSRVQLILGLANEEKISAETAGILLDNELKNLDFDIKKETIFNIQAQTEVYRNTVKKLQADTSLSQEKRNTEISQQALFFSQTVLNETETHRKFATLELELNRLASEVDLNREQQALVHAKGLTEFFMQQDIQEQMMTHKFYRQHQQEFLDLEKLRTFSHSMAEMMNAGTNQLNAFINAYDKTYNAEKDRENRLSVAQITALAKSIGIGTYIGKNGTPKPVRKL